MDVPSEKLAAHPAWSLRLLDHFSLRSPAGDAGLTARKSVALVIFLSLQRDRRARRDTIANLLWSNVDTAQGRVSLRQAIAAVRRVEGDVPLLLTDADTIALSPAIAIDVEEFARLADGDVADRTAAAALYRTDLVTGFVVREEPAFNEWLTITQAHWRQRAVNVLLSLCEAALTPGSDINAGITAALKLLSIDPFNEAAHRMLMQLYVRQGRAALALAQYRSLADLLRRELQVAPEAETQALFERMKGGRRVAASEPDRLNQSRPETTTPAADLTGESGSAAVEPMPAPPAASGKRAFRRWRALTATLIGGVAVTGSYMVWRSVERYFDRTPTIARVYPLAVGEGDERAPAMSPDGSLVAYMERRGGNLDLYMTSVEGGGDAVRLTTHPADDAGPAWRPDGRAIAFVRHTADTERPCRIIVRPVPVGPERTIGHCLHTYTTAPTWSADAKTIFFFDDGAGDLPYRIHAMTVATGEVRPVTVVGAGLQGDYAASVSHDGTQIAYEHRGVAASDLAVRDLATGATTLVRRSVNELYSVAWSADDAGLFYSVRSGSETGLWWTPASGDKAPVRLSSGLAGYSNLSVSASGKRMAVQVSDDRHSLLRLAPSDTTLLPTTVVPGIGANGFDRMATASRGGRIAFVSSRAGSERLWIKRVGGSPEPLVAAPGLSFNSLGWAPNGRILAAAASIDGKQSILVIDTENGRTRRLPGSEAGGLPAWSGSGEHLYWTSLRGDTPALVRMSLRRPGRVETVMRNMFGLARFTRDGRQLYYTTTGFPGLRRVSLDSTGMPTGRAEIVVRDLDPNAWDNWVLTDTAIVYPGAGLKRWTIATGATTSIADGSPERASLSLSPGADGAVYVRRTVRQNDITGMDFD